MVDVTDRQVSRLTRLVDGRRLLIHGVGRRGMVVIDAAALPLGARWLGSLLSVRRRRLRRRLLCQPCDTFLQLGNPAFNERLAFARGMVFSILRKIAMGASLGDGANDGGPFLSFQHPQLFFKRGQARGGHRKFLHSVSSAKIPDRRG